MQPDGTTELFPAAGEHVLATIAGGAEVLALVRLRIVPGCRVQGHTVAEPEGATRNRVLAWTEAAATPLRGTGR